MSVVEYLSESRFEGGSAGLPLPGGLLAEPGLVIPRFAALRNALAGPQEQKEKLTFTS